MTTPLQPAARPSSGFGITYADVLVAAGGLLVFFFSFAPLYSYAGISINSWHDSLTVFIVLAALLLIGTAVIDVVWPRERQIVGLHRHIVQVGLGLYVLVQMFGVTIEDKGGASLGWGGVFMLIGAIVAAAGAVLNHFNKLQTTLAIPTGGSSTGTPVGYVPPQGGYTTPPAQNPADTTMPIDPSAGS